MPEKEVTMRLKFATDMPPMPDQGYGAGTPATSNQHLFAADVVGAPITQGKFRPKHWAQQAQILADFHLSRGRVDDEGWGGFRQATDLTHHMYTAQGRYQASIPGSAAHAAVSSYHANIRDEKKDRQEQTAKHIDDFTSRLQTAATSLAYLTGASSGLTTALNRAGTVLASMQGVSGLMGMGGTSVGGVLSRMFTGGGVEHDGMSGSGYGTYGGFSGGGGAVATSSGWGGSIAGGIAAGVAGRGGIAKYGSMIARGILSGSGGLAGMAGGAAAGVGLIGYGAYAGKADGDNYEIARRINEIRAGVVGGGKVNARGVWVSNDKLLDAVGGQRSLRVQSFLGSQDYASTESGVIGQRHAYQSQIAGMQSQYMGTEGYERTVNGAWGNSGTASIYERRLAEQPSSLVSTMNTIYGNQYQAGGELASRLHDIREQGRGFALRNADLNVAYNQGEYRQGVVQSQLRDAQAFTRRQEDTFGDKSGAAMVAKQKEVDLEKELISIKAQQIGITKQIKDNESDVLKSQRQQSVETAKAMQHFINSEKASWDRSKVSYGMADPAQRKYIKNVLERFDKGGRKAVAPDEFSGIVAQYRGREAEASARETAEREGFKEHGKMSEDAVRAAEAELGKQKELILNLSRQVDVKLEADTKELAQEIAKLNPDINRVLVKMELMGRQIIEIADGLKAIQGLQKQ